MNIYLVQHGRPVNKEEDPKKPLSGQGKEDIERISAFLKMSGIKVGGIVHSGKTRAVQTAEILSAKLTPGKKPTLMEGLSPLDDVRIIADKIQQMENEIMIVGHLPHLGRLTSLLTTGSEANSVAGFQQGGVVCIRADETEKDWQIAWMIVPELM